MKFESRPLSHVALPWIHVYLPNFVFNTATEFENRLEDSGRREGAGEVTGRKIKYQRLDKGLINIKGQLGLKRVGGRESRKMPKKDLILSLKCHDNSKKEHLKIQTWREKTRGERWERMNDNGNEIRLSLHWAANLPPAAYRWWRETNSLCILSCLTGWFHCDVYAALSDAPEKHHRCLQIKSKSTARPGSHTSFPALTKETSVT